MAQCPTTAPKHKTKEHQKEFKLKNTLPDFYVFLRLAVKEPRENKPLEVYFSLKFLRRRITSEKLYLYTQ